MSILHLTLHHDHIYSKLSNQQLLPTACFHLQTTAGSNHPQKCLYCFWKTLCVMNCMSLTGEDWDQTGCCQCRDKGRMRWSTGLCSCFSLIGLEVAEGEEINQNVSRKCWEMHDKTVRTFVLAASSAAWKPLLTRYRRSSLMKQTDVWLHPFNPITPLKI